MLQNNIWFLFGTATHVLVIPYSIAEETKATVLCGMVHGSFILAKWRFNGHWLLAKCCWVYNSLEVSSYCNISSKQPHNTGHNLASNMQCCFKHCKIMKSTWKFIYGRNILSCCLATKFYPTFLFLLLLLGVQLICWMLPLATYCYIPHYHLSPFHFMLVMLEDLVA